MSWQREVKEQGALFNEGDDNYDENDFKKYVILHQIYSQRNIHFLLQQNRTLDILKWRQTT